MIELLDYPFNAIKIARKKISLKRELLQKNIRVKKKVAILGGSTTCEVKDQLELFLLKANIRADFYECDFSQYYEAVIFEEENLYSFNPDIIYMHVSNENIKSLYDYKKSSELKAAEEFETLKSIWTKLSENFNCLIIQDNFELPLYKSYGNLDSTYYSGTTRTITILNEMISNYAMQSGNFHVCDRNYLSTKIGLSIWKDYSLWLSAKYSLSYVAITNLSYTVSKIIESSLGFSKKCLVVDLDNTLWGGVIGDDGVEKIVLGKETPRGEAHYDLQLYIKELKNRGVILAICSKNEINNAKGGFDHPDSVLQLSDFTVIKADWNLKITNIYDIADELNIGFESMVFLDDNPTERDMVRREFHGSISVPEIGSDITKFREILDSSQLFTTIAFSQEDELRNDYYEDNKKREATIANFGSYDEYLKSLEMRAELSIFKGSDTKRITQLINKTNQFNLTGLKVSETEIDLIGEDIKKIALHARLSDKFGPNGLVSVIIGTIEGNSLTIDLWVMSCRVFNRTLEHAIIGEFLKIAKARGIETCIGKYIPTRRNAIVATLYEELGFSQTRTAGGTHMFELSLVLYEVPQNLNMKTEWVQ